VHILEHMYIYYLTLEKHGQGNNEKYQHTYRYPYGSTYRYTGRAGRHGIHTHCLIHAIRTTIRTHTHSETNANTGRQAGIQSYPHIGMHTNKHTNIQSDKANMQGPIYSGGHAYRATNTQPGMQPYRQALRHAYMQTYIHTMHTDSESYIKYIHAGHIIHTTTHGYCTISC